MSGGDTDAGPWPDEPETGWPHEPDDEGIAVEPNEFDPDSIGPEIPSPPDSSDVNNPETIRLFWKLVVVFNFALLALAIGPMFGVFLGQWDFGLQIFAVGVLAFAYGTFRYVQFRSTRDDGGDTGPEHNG